MADVIEIDAADRKISKLFEGRRRFDVRQDGGLRLESEWDEAGEAASFVLELAQLAQVIDTLRERFDVAVKHCAMSRAPHCVPGARQVEPFLRGFFAATNFIPHLGSENLRAAARHGAEASLAQSFERVADRHPENSLREMAHLDSRKRLDMQIGIKCPQTPDKIEIPILLQGRVQTADHMNFCDSQSARGLNGANDIVDRSLKCVGVALLRGKCAELAREHANVRVIDVTIENVSGDVPVLLFAHRASHNAERVEIVRPI